MLISFTLLSSRVSIWLFLWTCSFCEMWIALFSVFLNIELSYSLCYSNSNFCVSGGFFLVVVLFPWSWFSLVIFSGMANFLFKYFIMCKKITSRRRSGRLEGVVFPREEVTFQSGRPDPIKAALSLVLLFLGHSPSWLSPQNLTVFASVPLHRYTSHS